MPLAMASRSFTTMRPMLRRSFGTDPARWAERMTPGARRMGWSRGGGSCGKTSMAALKRPSKQQVREGVEVDEVGAADEDENRVGLDAFQHGAIEQGAILRRRDGQHVDQRVTSRGGVRGTRRSTPCSRR